MFNYTNLRTEKKRTNYVCIPNNQLNTKYDLLVVVYSYTDSPCPKRERYNFPFDGTDIMFPSFM